MMLLWMFGLALASEPCQDALYWSHWPVPTPFYDDENCYVEHPAGSAYVWANQFYTLSERTGCPLGTFDGSACYVRADLPGSFVWDNAFYTAPWASGGVQCPTGSWFDGGNCYWFHASPDTTAYIAAGGWRTTATPVCADGVFDGVHCYHGGPPAGTTAYIWDNAFYYTFDEVHTNDALHNHVRECGDSYGSTDLNDCVNKFAPLPPSILRGISTPEPDYRLSPDPIAPRTAVTRDGCVADSTPGVMTLGEALPVDTVTRTWAEGRAIAGDTVVYPYDRSSNDGRVTLFRSRSFTLFRPDDIGYDDTAPPTDTFGWQTGLNDAVLGITDGSPVYHATICDASGGNIEPGKNLSENRNPRACTWTELVWSKWDRAYHAGATRSGDCYDLSLVYAPSKDAEEGRWWLGSVDLTVFVEHPKSAAAASPVVLPRTAGTTFSAPVFDRERADLRSELRTMWLDRDADAVRDAGEQWSGCRGSGCGTGDVLPAAPDRPAMSHKHLAIFEMTTSSDGRLMVLNTMDGLYYSYNRGTPCHAADFGRWLPLSHMPFDADVAHLGLAASGAATGGFRDVRGVLISDLHRFVGAYPWIDRQAKNLVFALNNQERNGWIGRDGYPSTGPGDQTNMDGTAGKGVGVIGGWTQGKLVYLDNMLNPTDWSGRRSCESLPWADTLYGEARGEFRAFDVDLYRYGGPTRVRPAPSAMIGSPENQFNHLDALSPVLPNDVVWRVSSNNGHTAEMAFDDYLRNDALVVAHMNAAQQRVTRSDGAPDYIPWDGFEPTPGCTAYSRTDTPRLQNASTASTAFDPGAVNPPSDLSIRGGARVEPVALGGVLGKGVYLDGRNDFIDTGYLNTGRTDWSYNLWIDLRTITWGELRTVFHWADGSWLAMSQEKIRAYNASAGTWKEVEIGRFGLESGRFVHLAVDSYLEGEERVLDVFLNGDPTPAGTMRWGLTGRDRALYSGFSMDYAGLGGWSWFVVGSYGGKNVPPTLRGWVDELRIYALHDRAADFRKELRCNLALGTIRRDDYLRVVGPFEREDVSYPEPREWCEQLDLSSHDTPTELGPQHDLTACADEVHHNPDHGAADCRRHDLLGLAGLEPLAGAPRADQSANGFCLSCHVAGAPIDGLDTHALVYSGVDRECDGRRQPMDHVGVMGGAAVAPMVGLPSASCDPTAGWGAYAGASWLADPWLDVMGKVTP